jgi:hypothetical protein
MNSAIQLVSIAVALLVALIVTQLIRRRKLREEYALLWFAASVVLLVFASKRDLLDRLATLVGISYSPSLLLLGVILLGFLLALHFSVSLSRLSEQNKRLAQEVALLRLRLDAESAAQRTRG